MQVNPYIAFKGDCRQAIEFYKNALQAEEVYSETFGESPMAGMAPADQIMHATIRVGESNIMMSDDPNPVAGTTGGNITLAIQLKDPARAQELFDNLAKGGTIVMPIEKTFWADAFGMVTDQFGVKWMVNCDASH
jgi:PhnB protein